jgi:hypothetical protein
MEALKFSDQTVFLRVPGAPTITSASASSGPTATGSATVTWTAPAANGGPAITSYQVVATPSTGPAITVVGLSAAARTRTVTGLVNGTTYTLQVRAVNLLGAGPLSAASNSVTPVGLAGAPTALVASRGNTTVDLSWTAPANNGGSAITGYQVQVRIGTTVVRTDPPIGNVTSTTITGLTNGTAYTFRVQAINAFGAGALSAASSTVTPATVPDPPGILAPAQGPAGGSLTAVANWAAPASNGGAAITGYTVTALRMAADGVTPVGTPTVAVTNGATRSRSFTLPAGNYRFEVFASNSAGNSVPSPRSDIVVPR